MSRGDIMSEKITKPEKFTKEWYGYIWDYYKAHILIGIAAVVILSFLITNMANTVRYDANINYITTDVLTTEKADKLALACSANSDDLNGNGRVDIAINQLNFTEENRQSGEMYQALLNNMYALFNSTDELLFVTDKEMLLQLTGTKYTPDIFYKTAEWLGESINEENEYAAPLSESAVLNELAIDASDLYVLVAKTDSEDGFKPEEENAIKIAKFLLK